MVHGTFSPARAWRPAVGPASPQTLGVEIQPTGSAAFEYRTASKPRPMPSLRAPVSNFHTGAPSRLPVPRQCSAAERWQRRVPRATRKRCSKSASWHGAAFALSVSCRRNCSGTARYNAPAVPHTINAYELAARRSVWGWRFAPQCCAWQAVRCPLRPRPTPRASVSAGTDSSNSAQCRPLRLHPSVFAGTVAGFGDRVTPIVATSSTKRHVLQHCASTPNPSFEARPNGRPPGPRRSGAYDLHRGPGVLPSVPPQLER